MWKRTLAIAALAACGWATGPTWAAGTPDTAAQDPIYGSQLMTPQERDEYRRRMQRATTAAERERIRQVHQGDMQQRAREHGMSLSQQPPGRPLGSGMGPGMQGGMGSAIRSGTGAGVSPRTGGGSGMGPATSGSGMGPGTSGGGMEPGTNGGGLRPQGGVGPRGATP